MFLILLMITWGYSRVLNIIDSIVAKKNLPIDIDLWVFFFLFIMVETYSKLGMRHENWNVFSALSTIVCLRIMHWHVICTRMPTSQHAVCMTVYHDIENSIFVLFSLTLLVKKNGWCRFQKMAVWHMMWVSIFWFLVQNAILTALKQIWSSANCFKANSNISAKIWLCVFHGSWFCHSHCSWKYHSFKFRDRPRPK